MKTATQVTLIVLIFNACSAFSQTTDFQKAYAIFQANCTVGCHSGSSPSGNLDLGGTEQQVFNNLVNVFPTNPYAKDTLKQKLVEPGSPARSFLFRKVNNGLDTQLELHTAEGNAMPDGQPAMAPEEIEIIRQWILWGATDTSTAINETLINDYYNGPGMPEMSPPPTPEEEGKEGYQAKFGPIFVEPGGEFEYFQLFDPPLDEDREIHEMYSKLHPYCHHWVIREMDTAFAANLGYGPVTGALTTVQAFVYQYATYMGVWMFEKSIDLPEGTAIYQDSSDIMLLNLHIPNYSQDSILAATAYLNVYTSEAGSGAVEMKTDLKVYGEFDPWVLQIPPTGAPYTLEDQFTVPGDTFYFWTLQSHTHEIGQDYDMFLANPDGTRGDKIYEGFYNADYTFNQGFYDYTHPPVRAFEPLLEVDMSNGLIFEATWLNNTGDTIPFGYTTQEEMFITYYQYTEELPQPSGINSREGDKRISVYPNPFSDNTTLEIPGSIPLEQLQLNIYDMLGKHVKSYPVISSRKLNISMENLHAGIYLYRLSTANRVVDTGKLLLH